MTQNVSLKCTAVKHFSCKNPRWLTDDTLERPVLHHCEILFFSIFKMAAARPGFLRLKFLTAVYFSDTLCIIVANFVEISYSVVEISQFFWVF